MSLDFKVTRCFKFEGEGTLKALCDVAICDGFLVKGLRIINGKKGLFVSMPGAKGKDGKWYDNMHPLTAEVRNSLNEAVLSAYADN
jgi:stage V sporulation protein G